MSKNSLNGLSATQLASMLQAGEMTALELAERYLDDIAQYHDQSIFITVTKDRALAEAKASDARRVNDTLLSPWDGIPIAWKGHYYARAGESLTSLGLKPLHIGQSIVETYTDDRMISALIKSRILPA